MEKEKTIKGILEEFLVFTEKYAKYPKDIEEQYLVNGLCNESLEFYLEIKDKTNLSMGDRNKVLSEVSDVFWYALRLGAHLSYFYHLCHSFESLNFMFEYVRTDINKDIIITKVNKLMSYYKKYLRGDYELCKEEFFFLISDLLVGVTVLTSNTLGIQNLNLTKLVESIYSTNVEKLEERYGN